MQGAGMHETVSAKARSEGPAQEFSTIGQKGRGAAPCAHAAFRQQRRLVPNAAGHRQ